MTLDTISCEDNRVKYIRERTLVLILVPFVFRKQGGVRVILFEDGACLGRIRSPGGYVCCHKTCGRRRENKGAKHTHD